MGVKRLIAVGWPGGGSGRRACSGNIQLGAIMVLSEIRALWTSVDNPRNSIFVGTGIQGERR
jgi:hypothetical protein